MSGVKTRSYFQLKVSTSRHGVSDLRKSSDTLDHAAEVRGPACDADGLLAFCRLQSR